VRLLELRVLHREVAGVSELLVVCDSREDAEAALS
jgi:hypothetical protein